MKFIDSLYFGEKVRKKGNRIIKKIRKGSFFTGAYVICLPESRKVPVEYYSARLLLQDYYKTHEPVIIGIAADEEEAMEVTAVIIKDCMEKTGTLDVRNYTEGLAGAAAEDTGKE